MKPPTAKLIEFTLRKALRGDKRAAQKLYGIMVDTDHAHKLKKKRTRP